MALTGRVSGGEGVGEVDVFDRAEVLDVDVEGVSDASEERVVRVVSAEGEVMVSLSDEVVGSTFLEFPCGRTFEPAAEVGVEVVSGVRDALGVTVSVGPVGSAGVAEGEAGSSVLSTVPPPLVKTTCTPSAPGSPFSVATNVA